VDAGLNNQHNYPVLASTSVSGGNVNIAGTLDSTAGGTFTIEFFASPTADPSGFGEGKNFLGSTTVTDSNNDCLTSFNISLPYAVSTGTFITATATDANGNTSEFSAVKSFAPTAASVQVSGRVRTANDKGIGNVIVSLVDSSGTNRQAYTNEFGVYQFDDIQAGETCILSVRHKHYLFVGSSSVLFTANEETNNLNFTAVPVKKVKL
jgi:hypothetical protein